MGPHICLQLKVFVFERNNLNLKGKAFVLCCASEHHAVVVIDECTLVIIFVEQHFPVILLNKWQGRKRDVLKQALSSSEKK